MSLRSPAPRIALAIAALMVPLGILQLGAAIPARAGDFVDSADRPVALPDRIDRVMAAEPAAAVLIAALAPDRLIGWPGRLDYRARTYLSRELADLPVVGGLEAPPSPAMLARLRRLRPALIVDAGPVTAARAAHADSVERATGIPYILIDDSFARIPDILRTLGAVLGVEAHARALATAAAQAIDSVRGGLLIQSPVDRPLLYFGQGEDGLETAPSGSPGSAVIDQAGAVNVAVGPAPGATAAGTQPGMVRVTRAQVLAWNPGVIVAERRSFYEALLHDPQWAGLAAVRNRRVYLAPSAPFGWLDDPDGINRIIGLDWLSTVLYPEAFQEDLRSDVTEFYDRFYHVKLSAKTADAVVRSAEARPGELRRSGTGGLLSAPPPPGALPLPGAGATPSPSATGAGRHRTAPPAFVPPPEPGQTSL